MNDEPARTPAECVIKVDGDEIDSAYPYIKTVEVRMSRQVKGHRYRSDTSRFVPTPLDSPHPLRKTEGSGPSPMPYYDLEFFEQISQSLADQLLVVLAEDNAEPLAAAVFFIGKDVLYGRYWGSVGHHNALHFETCYYQGIDFCIEHGIARFEPGTQGEHKISRGFVPVTTYSAHWLAQPEFFDAIGQYVAQEARHIDRYMRAVDEHSPYRDDTAAADEESG